MRPANQIDVIFLIEVFHNYLSEGVGNTSVILAPIDDVFFWVGRITPQEVAKKPAVRHIRWSQDLVDLLQIVQLW